MKKVWNKRLISTQAGTVTSPYYNKSKLCGTKHYLAVIEVNPQYDVDEVFDFTLNTRFLTCDPVADKFTCAPYTKSSFGYSVMLLYLNLLYQPLPFVQM